MERRLNRRQFVGTGGAMAGASLLRLTAPALAAAAQAACTAKEQGASFQTLTPAEAIELDAIAARILPTTETPGAKEAGVIHFIDNVLGKELAHMLGGVRGMLAEFLADVPERFPQAATFSELDNADQDAFLKSHEETAFFGAMRALTIMGFFAMSSYGGNQNNVGWELIGFAGHSATQPPFGYYDAEYAKERSDGR